MEQHVRVAVASQAEGMVDGDAPQDQGSSFHQTMYVVAVTDAKVHGLSLETVMVPDGDRSNSGRRWRVRCSRWV